MVTSVSVAKQLAGNRRPIHVDWRGHADYFIITPAKKGKLPSLTTRDCREADFDSTPEVAGAKKNGFRVEL